MTTLDKNNEIQTRFYYLLVFAIALTALPAMGPDLGHWIKAGENVFQSGFVEGYRLSNQEHPPGLSILMFTGIWIAENLGIFHGFGIKFLLFGFFLASWGLIQKNIASKAATLILSMSLVLSALVFSYVDILLFPFIFTAITCLQKKQNAAAASLLTLAALIKFYPLIAGPFFLIYFLAKTDYRPRLFFSIALIPLCLILVTAMLYGGSLTAALGNAFGHQALSAQGLNLNWLILESIRNDINPFFSGTPQAYEQSNFPLFTKGLMLFFYLSTLILFCRSEKTLEQLLYFSIVGHLAYFIFAIGVHENHLFLSLSLAIGLAAINKNHSLLAINIALVSAINYLLFYGFNSNPAQLWGDAMTGMCQYLDTTQNTPHFAYCDWVLERRTLDVSRAIMAGINICFFLVLWGGLIWGQRDTHESSILMMGR